MGRLKRDGVGKDILVLVLICGVLWDGGKVHEMGTSPDHNVY